MTLATFDLQNSNEKIINLALKYGYNSLDSFCHAFVAVHGIVPSKARISGVSLKTYPCITFSLSLKGVIEINYKLQEKSKFTIVGVKERFSYAVNLGEMWNETSKETIMQIGEFADVEAHGLVGVYDGMYDDSTTDYYIAAITKKDYVGYSV